MLKKSEINNEPKITARLRLEQGLLRRADDGFGATGVGTVVAFLSRSGFSQSLKIYSQTNLP